jgi:putative spermidine/putrescine transport system ATP-binding protein
MSSIRLSKVSKHYGSLRAADDVDLSVGEGEFVTILGPSGSGKTTLLLLIAGLLTPSAGRIHIGTRDVTESPSQARNIGLVFQSYALFPHMTVFDNVVFPLGVRGVAREEARDRVEEALRLVRLDGMARRKPSQLSGGQQQRVALARAIVFKPEILLLDEPLGALDRKLREQLQVELKQLQRTLGITTILVTHDQEEALSLSDRIVVLNEGRVQQIASPQDAYLRPANRFVADFLGIANFIALPGGEGIVRPERVKVSLPTSAGDPGRVAETVYLGQSIRYHIELDRGGAIVGLASFSDPGFRIGDRVSVSWAPTDVWPVSS